MRVLVRCVDAEGRKWYAIGELEDVVVRVGDTDTKGSLRDMVSLYDVRLVIDGE